MKNKGHSNAVSGDGDTISVKRPNTNPTRRIVKKAANSKKKKKLKESLQSNINASVLNSRLSVQTLNLLLVFVEFPNDSFKTSEIQELYRKKFGVDLVKSPYHLYTSLISKGFLVYDDTKNADIANKELHGQGNYRKFMKCTPKAIDFINIIRFHYTN